MRILSKYIVKEHISPFIMALFVLLFVLLANFLLKSIDKFLGKGLDMFLLGEFMFLNLAWILALAVPMAVLVATLMAFGRLSSDNEIMAMRSSGTGFLQLLLPAIGFGTGITLLMIIFNNFALPEMNHKARLLSSDLSRKRPDLEFEVGYFIDTLPENNILLGGRKDDLFTDIIIFNKATDISQRTVTAKEGTIEMLEDGVLLNLSNGVIHELSSRDDEYRQIFFDHYQVIIPVDNLSLNRRDSSIRGDREMNYTMMQDKISSFHEKVDNVRARVNNRLSKEALINIPTFATFEEINLHLDRFSLSVIDSLNAVAPKKVDTFKRRIKNLKRGIQSDFSLINSYLRSINKYTVELHKKFSIPMASLVFILIGAPLGIMARKGGFSVSMAFSLGFFIIYWAFLIAGEEFADRGSLSPPLSMWLPNLILGALGIFLCYRTSREQKFINFEILNIFKKNGNSA
ncbi:MAG: YjgP/YjgQ family permease [Candidatus Marinimicrobia bacterium]|nr:YjgP/YjgQ family permease [Candidatus Neomarinimicrobiota bacterium]